MELYVQNVKKLKTGCFHERCKTKGEFEKDGLNFSKHTQNSRIAQSPAKAMKKLGSQANTIRTGNAKIKRYSSFF